jgi:hypothetical protein
MFFIPGYMAESFLTFGVPEKSLAFRFLSSGVQHQGPTAGVTQILHQTIPPLGQHFQVILVSAGLSFDSDLMGFLFIRIRPCTPKGMQANRAFNQRNRKRSRCSDLFAPEAHYRG